MSKKQFIKRHHLIINKLRSNPCSFNDLQGYLQRHSIDDEENYMIASRAISWRAMLRHSLSPRSAPMPKVLRVA